MRDRWYSLFDELLLRAQLDTLHIKSLHVERLWKYVLSHKGAEAHDVPDLPQSARDLLQSKFRVLTSKVESCYNSADGRTTKLLIVLQGGQSVEAVIMRHNAATGKYAGGPRPGGPRATLCVSSQVGCKMGCTFCATGDMGFKANLSAGEIVEQLVHAIQITDIRNVVFMGMGEPMNNYRAVIQAVQSMTGHSFRLSPKHITISTVGVIPGILSLKSDVPGVNLAVSIHAPTQELRCQIVPAARAFPLSKLILALDAYLNERTCKVFIEYIMLASINDTEIHAHELGELLRARNVVVNLIPYNPSNVSVPLRASEHNTVLQFQKILREVYQLRTTVRQQLGQDIAGACGQLALIQPPKQPQGLGAEVTVLDIEDIGNLHI